jgi:hypothetical protein
MVRVDSVAADTATTIGCGSEDDFNPQQQTAIETSARHTLVLASAGNTATLLGGIDSYSMGQDWIVGPLRCKEMWKTAS